MKKSLETKKIISPSILSADFSRMGEEVRQAEAAGADWIHVDVMDGRFVPNLTLGPDSVRGLRPVTRLPLDVHLMLAEPGGFLAPFARAGADRLTVHMECHEDAAGLLRAIRGLGKKAGLAVKPATKISSLIPLLAGLDQVLVMSVEPGFSGQRFMPAQMAKVRELAALRRSRKLKFLIEVDGGITETNAAEAWAAGADALVAGHSIFGKKNYARAILGLRGLRPTHV